MESDAATNSALSAGSVSFGPFTFDSGTGELRRDGEIVDLAPQPTRVLAMLLARAGRLVTRDELQRHLWPDTIVEFDHGLNTCIRALRAALGERAGEPTCVQTVPRRGYRFIADIRVAGMDDPSDLPASDAAHVPDPSRRRQPLPRTWLITALAVAAVTIAAAGWLLHRNRPAPRLAVLSFDNLSPDLVPDFALEGLAEEIALALANNDPRDLVVITRGSVEAVRARGLPRAAHALRASHVLTGTARSTGHGVVITASLGRTSDQSMLWAERYHADADVLAGQIQEVAAAIAGVVARQLGAVPPRPAPRLEPAARAALLRARYLLTEGRAADAIALIETDVPRHDRTAAAQATVARAHLRLGDTIAARAAADRAIELDSAVAEGHFARAELAALSWWDWSTARRAYEAAIRLEPGRAEFRHAYAYLLSILGQHRAAIREIALTLELDPVSPVVNGDVAWLHYFARDNEGAIRQAEITLELVPDDIPARHCLMLALESDGQVDRARQVALDIARRQTAPTDVLASIRDGNPAAALRTFWRWFVGRANREPDDANSFELAYGYARIGDADSAFRHLGRAMRQRSPFAPAAAVDPRFDPIRSDPRFADHLEALRLPGSPADVRR